MKITFEHYDIKAEISVESDDKTVEDVIEELVIPVLVAAGFAKESIEEAMGEYHECECDDCDKCDSHDGTCSVCGFPEELCCC